MWKNEGVNSSSFFSQLRCGKFFLYWVFCFGSWRGSSQWSDANLLRFLMRSEWAVIPFVDLFERSNANLLNMSVRFSSLCHVSNLSGLSTGRAWHLAYIWGYFSEWRVFWGYYFVMQVVRSAACMGVMRKKGDGGVTFFLRCFFLCSFMMFIYN